MLKRKQNIIKKLQKQENMNFVPKASIKQIRNFEVTNKITLPKMYRKWLLFSDGGELFLPAGVQIYGVDHNPRIDLNDNDRINENYIVIGALSSGDSILCEKNGERILIYDHHSSLEQSEEEIFFNFFDFLEKLETTLGVKNKYNKY